MVGLSLTFIALLWVLFVLTWVFYIALMAIKREWKNLPLSLKIAIAPFVPPALLLDVLFNAIIGTIVFIELPTEWLFSSRCQRHIKDSFGIQQRKARWFCRHMLNPYDPSGNHCD